MQARMRAAEFNACPMPRKHDLDVMSAVALLAEGRAKTDAEVREHMSGNLCRCGAYPNIIAAIQTARKAGA